MYKKQERRVKQTERKKHVKHINEEKLERIEEPTAKENNDGRGQKKKRMNWRKKGKGVEWDTQRLDTVDKNNEVKQR